MPNKQRTYRVPVRIEWDMLVRATTKSEAVANADKRLKVMVSFGTNEGRTPRVLKDKVTTWKPKEASNEG